MEGDVSLRGGKKKKGDLSFALSRALKLHKHTETGKGRNILQRKPIYKGLLQGNDLQLRIVSQCLTMFNFSGDFYII